MELFDVVEKTRAARENRRISDLELWQKSIINGIIACSEITQDDLVRRKHATPDQDWLGFDVLPEGSTLEAWTDTEGVLDIEVPRELVADLVLWLEGQNIRVGVELSMTPQATLHISYFRTPPDKES